jgi:cytochrome c553
MAAGEGLWANRGVRWSVFALFVLTVATLVVGFIWLPSASPDFAANGLWQMICRAAGVPERWTGAAEARASRSTAVVLDVAMAKKGTEESIGHGATLALQCTMCHGARGMSQADAPNLAGQYPEVIVKQLHDYKAGDRVNAVMEALAATLSEQDIADLAAYFASLPRPHNSPITDMSTVPALVRVGSPLRNVAPCASCHGGIEQKFGAPWLEGMPRAYLMSQMEAFASGTRRNDSMGQMRNMARPLSRSEMEQISEFYSRHGEGAAQASAQ